MVVHERSSRCNKFNCSLGGKFTRDTARWVTFENSSFWKCEFVIESLPILRERTCSNCRWKNGQLCVKKSYNIWCHFQSVESLYFDSVSEFVFFRDLHHVTSEKVKILAFENCRNWNVFKRYWKICFRHHFKEQSLPFTTSLWNLLYDFSSSISLNFIEIKIEEISTLGHPILTFRIQ